MPLSTRQRQPWQPIAGRRFWSERDAPQHSRDRLTALVASASGRRRIATRPAPPVFERTGAGASRKSLFQRSACRFVAFPAAKPGDWKRRDAAASRTRPFADHRGILAKAMIGPVSTRGAPSSGPSGVPSIWCGLKPGPTAPATASADNFPLRLRRIPRAAKLPSCAALRCAPAHAAAKRRQSRVQPRFSDRLF